MDGSVPTCRIVRGSGMPRSADIAIALCALAVLLPLLLALAAAILVAMGRPVLFLQERVGRDGRTFRIVKFRSLPVGGGRASGLGRLMRRYSLDELPEFWNVIRGDMALVGPRPLLAADQPDRPSLRRARLRLRPGITGWAQINGRNANSFERTYRLDRLYARKRSAAFDLVILARTLPCILRRAGADRLTETAPRGLNPRQPAGA